MNYQPPKALQAQSKNRAIKPAIQNKFEFDSKNFLSDNVTIASSLSGTTTIPHGFPSTLILFSCLPSLDNTRLKALDPLA
jgi:hypothetical protein